MPQISHLRCRFSIRHSTCPGLHSDRIPLPPPDLLTSLRLNRALFPYATLRPALTGPPSKPSPTTKSQPLSRTTRRRADTCLRDTRPHAHSECEEAPRAPRPHPGSLHLGISHPHRNPALLGTAPASFPTRPPEPISPSSPATLKRWRNSWKKPHSGNRCQAPKTKELPSTH